MAPRDLARIFREVSHRTLTPSRRFTLSDGQTTLGMVRAKLSDMGGVAHEPHKIDTGVSPDGRLSEQVSSCVAAPSPIAASGRSRTPLLMRSPLGGC